MLYNILFSKGLLYLLLPTTILIVISSNNWLFIWIGLELNLLSFIPLIINSSKYQESDAIIKYFLIQALGSRILLLASRIILFNEIRWITPLLVTSSIIIKLGIAPCHFWFPSVIASISWTSCLILRTLQKVAPLTILIYTSLSSYIIPLIILLASINVILGGSMGIAQTKIKSIIAFSSITHIGWILRAKISFIPCTAIAYLAIYSVIIMPLIIYIAYSSLNFSYQLNQNSSFNFIKIFSIPILLLSLGGIPPLLGFIPKWLIIMYLNTKFSIIIILIIGSIINLYFYLRIVFNSIMTPFITKPKNIKDNKWRKILNISATISTLALPMWVLSTFINYAMTILN